MSPSVAPKPSEDTSSSATSVHYAYHSCRNRHCPQCGGNNTRKWLDACREALLPVHYFHVTLPGELVRSNQEALLSGLCRAAAYSLLRLAEDPRYVGGKIGILCVVHTWTRAMVYHPHVHCLVPGGGLSPDGSRWIPSRKNYLVPVEALSPIFRAKFMELARSALPHARFPQSLWQKSWVVYSKPGVQGTEKVLQYLARYVHRVAITDRRILSTENGHVRFRYKDSRNNVWKEMSLTAQEFIRRFLQHVLPRGFHKVRRYGLLAPSNQRLLHRARELLDDGQTTPDSPNKDESSPCGPLEPMICPACKSGHLFFVRMVPRKGRAPP